MIQFDWGAFIVGFAVGTAFAAVVSNGIIVIYRRALEQSAKRCEQAIEAVERITAQINQRSVK